MDNLINFEEIVTKAVENPKFYDQTPVPFCPSLFPQRESVDQSNPFENSPDDNPFDVGCLEKLRNPPAILDLQDGSAFSFDSFMSLPKTDSSHITVSTNDSSLSSGGSGKIVVSRSQSDSSVASARTNRPPLRSNRSVDQIPSKAQQLLKLSLMNAQNSPKNSSSMADLISSEALKLFKQFQDSGDLSFEDLNNISHQLVDSSMTDYDLQDMSVKFLSSISNAIPQAQSSPSSAKMAVIQEQLKRIKQEVKDQEDSVIALESSEPVTDKVEPKEEPIKVDHNGSGDAPIIISPVKVNAEAKLEPTAQTNGTAEAPELDGLLENLRSVINEGNRDEAKKHLQRLNDMLNRRKQPSEPKNPSNTLAVQPIVRQGTFEIDPHTGNRQYNTSKEKEKPREETAEKSEREDLLQKLTQLLSTQSIGVNALNLDALGGNGAKIFVVVPPNASAISTPARPAARRSMSLSVPQKQPVVLKAALESKKIGTPMKTMVQPSRTSAFTAPRPLPATVAPKSSLQTRVGAVRKSLMGPIDKTPQVPKTTASTSKVNPRISLAMRRSSIAKLSTPGPSLPTIQTTKASPPKQIRPATGAPYAAATTRRLSHLPATPARPSSTFKATPATASRTRPMTEQKKPTVSQFKAPSVVRKAAAAANEK